MAKLLTFILVYLFSLSSYASQSSATIQITFVVPVVCKITNNAPDCNLTLTKIDNNTWIDAERGYKVTVFNGILTIEALE